MGARERGVQEKGLRVRQRENKRNERLPTEMRMMHDEISRRKITKFVDFG